MQNNGTRFSWPVRVYHEDTDGHGIVYYANYFKFFERARTEMLRSLGFEQNELKRRLALVFVVKSVQVDFAQPAMFNDELQVTADIAEIRSASLCFNQKITKRNQNQRDVCQAIVRVACLNAESFKPKRLPTKLLELINDIN